MSKRAWLPSRRTLRHWGYGYLFTLPWIVGVSVFFLYATAQSLHISFSHLVIDQGLVFQPLTNLFDNYASVFMKEINFPITLADFAVGLLLQAPIIVCFALLIALMLNSRIKGRAVYRMIFFLPVIIATGPVMSQLTAQGAATVPLVSRNTLYGILGGLPPFIFEPVSELFSSLILVLWNSGVQILIFLAGLQKVPRVLYEAARIDGASGWECFWKITLPTVRSLVLLNAIYTIVTLATGNDNAIITLIYEVTYTSVTKGYSYGTAMAWIYAVIVSLLLLAAWGLLRERSDRHVKYEQKRARNMGVRT